MPTNAALSPTRRHFFKKSAASLGAAALSQLLRGSNLQAAGAANQRAKRVIYMFQSGAPSQIDLLDYKPQLEKLHGSELPASVRMGQRLTGMTAGQKNFRFAKNPWAFKRYGGSGLGLGENPPPLRRRPPPTRPAAQSPCLPVSDRIGPGTGSRRFSLSGRTAGSGVPLG